MVGAPTRIRAWLMVPVIMLVFLSACGSDPETELIHRAESEMEAGRFNQAEEIHRRYLREFPEGRLRDQVLFELGQVLCFTLGRKSESVGIFEQLLKNHPQSVHALQTREILADLYYWGTQNHRLALIEYQRLLVEKPDHSRAPYFELQMARCLIRTDQADQAVEHLEKLIRDYPKSEVVQSAYDELAAVHRASGRHEKALFVYRSLLDRFPRSERKTDFEFKMALILEDLSRDTEAMNIYRNLLDKYENRRVIEIRIEALEARRKKK